MKIPTNLTFRHLSTVALLAATTWLAGCHAPVRTPDAWAQSRQMVVVTIPDWTSIHGTMRRFERAPDGQWTPVGSADPVVIGKGGAGWGLGLNPRRTDGPMKKEGDGRSPAGVFEIGPAFGYASTAETGLQYMPMTASNYCVDVGNSPLYNRIVDADKVGMAAVEGATEHMRLDLVKAGDMRYAEGFVIEHNAQQTPFGGSCIFGHIWGGPDRPTAGCTAMPADTMRTVLAWLRKDARPVEVLLTDAKYRELQREWALPALD